MTAQHWRTIRLKLIQSGVGDPMGLPSMHVLLDLTESLILESMVSDDPKEDKAQREDFQSSLYRVKHVQVKGKPDGWREPPPGFEDGADDAAFDVFIKVAR